MQRLSVIAYRLPYSPASTGFLSHLRTLLATVPYASAAPGRMQLAAAYPPGALPVTVFEIAEVAAPEVSFGSWSLVVKPAEPPEPRTADAPPIDALAALDMAELTARLAGHIEAVDHTGINLPTSVVPDERWRSIVTAVAGVSALYRYPTGEPWLFVLPTTAPEHADDIRAFAAGREPRFELVHDEWLDVPLWQFALRTDLPRADLETLFPEPIGTAFPGLGEVFRAVTVRSPWPGLHVRFDLYYRSATVTDWETGEWLVTEGGRIRST